MKLGRCALVGTICGAFGAGIWAAIAHYANAEIGWIAWGVGLLVGLGVLKAANGENGLDTGFLAALIAVVAIVGGKFAASHLAASNALGRIELTADKITDEDMIVEIADEVVGEFETKKKRVAWPAGKSVENSTEKADYPRDVWAEADKRWKAKPADERLKLKKNHADETNAFIANLGGQIRDQGFQNSFSGMDVIFFGLAIVTAFKFGAGVQGGD